MKPALPARPSFTRLGSDRFRLSSGDSSDHVIEEDADSKKVTMVHDDAQSDTCSNHLSLTFSEVDDTDSAAEAETVREGNEVKKDEVVNKDIKDSNKSENISIRTPLKPFFNKTPSKL